MDCGVGWKLGSHGGGVAAPGSEAIVAWIWVVAVGCRDVAGSHWVPGEGNRRSLQAHDMGTTHSGALSGKWPGARREQCSGAGLGQA